MNLLYMNLKQIVVSGIAMLALDAVYLSTFSNFFNKLVTSIQGSNIKFNIVGAILCYILLIGGLNYFIISRKKSLQEAFLLGIVIYGVYETTNLAIFNKWSMQAVALDTLWGGILFALTSWVTYKLA
jgi:uncharacterized membrane protein